MADACMPERFYELAQPPLPAEKERGPKCGRRLPAHRTKVVNNAATCSQTLDIAAKKVAEPADATNERLRRPTPRHA
jgi:hypothetical protein